MTSLSVSSTGTQQRMESPHSVSTSPPKPVSYDEVSVPVVTGQPQTWPAAVSLPVQRVSWDSSESSFSMWFGFVLFSHLLHDMPLLVNFGVFPISSGHDICIFHKTKRIDTYQIVDKSKLKDP